jgi:hypothetical protein
MAWGEPHTTPAETELAEVVRIYVQHRTTGNFEKLQKALADYDRVKTWS